MLDDSFQLSIKMKVITIKQHLVRRLSTLHQFNRLQSISASRLHFKKSYLQDEISKMTLGEWSEAFKKETVDVAKMDSTSISYNESADRMRELLRTKLLRHDDIVKNPDRFFLAHRLLAYHAPQLGPGFWIRFTVHYNLCIGSIVGLGSDEQINLLDQWQDEGAITNFI